jgi:hypothetical protein
MEKGSRTCEEKKTTGLSEQLLYETTRTAKLHQWYADTENPDLTIRNKAAARLQLQIEKRENRQKFMFVRKERDMCKVGGDIAGLSRAKGEMKQLHGDMGRFKKFRDNGTPDDIMLNFSTRWFRDPVPLDEIMARFEFDRQKDFGLSGLYLSPHNRALFFRQNVPFGQGASVKESGSFNHNDPISQSGPANLNSQNTSMEATHCQNIPINQQMPVGQNNAFRQKVLVKTATQPFHTHDSKLIKTLDRTHDRIWEAHEASMRLHYSSPNTKEALWQTKLAIQKRAFQEAASNEIDVERKYLQPIIVPSRPRRLRRSDFMTQTTSKSNNRVTFEHGLWTLSSTKLWEHYEGGVNWNNSQWTPGGFLRLYTESGLSDLIFDFGNRTFIAHGVKLPDLASKKSFTYHTTCEQTSIEVPVTLIFIPHGRIEAQFPAIHLVSHDTGCTLLPLFETTVEFAGVPVGTFE